MCINFFNTLPVLTLSRHQLETFSALLSLCAGNPPSIGGSPHKGAVTRTFDVSLLSVWTNCWTNIIWKVSNFHYSDVIMNTMASPITGVSIVCSIVGSGADQRKHQSSVSLAFVRGIPQWPANSPQTKDNNAENVSIWWRHHAKRKECHHYISDMPQRNGYNRERGYVKYCGEQTHLLST